MIDEDGWSKIEERIKRNIGAQQERALVEEQRSHAALAKAIVDELERRGFLPQNK